MRVNFISLGIVVLVAFLVSGQVQAKPPQKVGVTQKVGTAVKEFFAKTHSLAYLPPSVVAWLWLIEEVKGRPVHVDWGIVSVGASFFASRGVFRLVDRYESRAAARKIDKFVQDAIDNKYVGKIVHYVDEGSHHVGRVDSSLPSDTGEVLALKYYDKQISIEQVEAVGSASDLFGDSTYGTGVVFLTQIAEPLNDVAARLVEEEGHGEIEGGLRYFFADGKVSVEVEHNFRDLDWLTKAHFLIDRDAILSYSE